MPEVKALAYMPRAADVMATGADWLQYMSEILKTNPQRIWTWEEIRKLFWAIDDRDTSLDARERELAEAHEEIVTLANAGKDWQDEYGKCSTDLAEAKTALEHDGEEWRTRCDLAMRQRDTTEFLLREAQARIEALEAENARLREAGKACLESSSSRTGGPCKCGACEMMRTALSPSSIGVTLTGGKGMKEYTKFELFLNYLVLACKNYNCELIATVGGDGVPRVAARETTGEGTQAYFECLSEDGRYTPKITESGKLAPERAILSAALSPAPAEPPTFMEYLRRQWKWSLETFGPGKRTAGVTKHIEKELAEVRESPDDLEEWVDLIMLSMDGYWRAGGTVDTILPDLLSKQTKNFAREWPEPQPGEPVEHLHAVPADPRREAIERVCNSAKVVGARDAQAKVLKTLADTVRDWFLRERDQNMKQAYLYVREEIERLQRK